MQENQESEKQQGLIFEREILVFVPSYNCAEYIVDTICGIPVELHDKICCLIIDIFSFCLTIYRLILT